MQENYYLRVESQNITCEILLVDSVLAAGGAGGHRERCRSGSVSNAGSKAEGTGPCPGKDEPYKKRRNFRRQKKGGL